MRHQFLACASGILSSALYAALCAYLPMPFHVGVSVACGLVSYQFTLVSFRNREE